MARRPRAFEVLMSGLNSSHRFNQQRAQIQNKKKGAKLEIQFLQSAAIL